MTELPVGSDMALDRMHFLQMCYIRYVLPSSRCAALFKQPGKDLKTNTWYHGGQHVVRNADKLVQHSLQAAC